MASITLNNVNLDYILKTGSDSLKQTIMQMCRPGLHPGKTAVQNSSFRALTDVNLELTKGDRIGLLGRNGAGKSTLLRVLGEIYAPSSGTINVDGSVSCLFDVGLGMNHEVTGYENIINLAIMKGRTKKEAEAIFADVEQFTELGPFLEQPVRTYSSGMQVKLAFAVATAFPPEIMLIDEIIGVGDAHFIEKSQARMKGMIDTCEILVLASHSNEIIKRFCNKAIVLDHGQIVYSGEVNDAIDYYTSTQVEAAA